MASDLFLLRCLRKAQSKFIVDQVVKDEDGSFKEELEAMRGQNAFGSFYSALKDTKVALFLIDISFMIY